MIIVLILLSVLCLVSVIVGSVLGLTTKDQFTPFSIHSILQADYSADVQGTPVSLVDIRIIRDILKDRYSFNDLRGLDAAFGKILDQLKTQVPSATPRFSPTPQPSPTSTVSSLPSPSPSPTKTLPASISPIPSQTHTPSPYPSITPSPTYRYYQVYPTSTKIPPTRTPRPTATRTATATPTTEPLALQMDIKPNPSQVNEPGGSVSYDLEMQNTSAYSLTLISLVDSQFGDLDGQGTCVTGSVIDPGVTLACAYPGIFEGNGGTSFTNQVTAAGQDYISRTVTVTETASVSILDVLPRVSINLEPDKSAISEPGEVVTYSILISNTSVETVTLTSLVDDSFGDLNGQGDCLTNGSIALGGNYTCAFSGMAAGNADSTFSNIVSVTVIDDEANSASANASASVSITDVLPDINLTLESGAPTLNEPGGEMVYSLQVENISVETVTIVSLMDSQFGNLDGVGTCSAGDFIASSATYTCVFTGTIFGNAGEVFTNFVTVEASDDEGNHTSEMASAAVTLTDALPAISVMKIADPAAVYEPGSTVNYGVQVENLGFEPVVLTGLLDSQFGGLEGQGSCALGGSIPAGVTYGCSFDGLVTGNAGDFHSNNLSATAQDDEGNLVSDSDTATVLIQNSIPTIEVSSTPAPVSILEPGGEIRYDLSVLNTSVETVTLTSLMDDTFGDLSALGCPVPTQMGIGGVYTCSYTGTISGNAGDVIINTLTAAGQDDEATLATGTTSSTVTITDAAPVIGVIKSVNQVSVSEPGDDVTFTVQVDNLSVEGVAIVSLTDDLEGDLDGKGTCNSLTNPYPIALASGGSYTCEFSAFVGGNAGESMTSTTTATAEDDEANMALDSDGVMVTITDLLPSILITKTSGVSSLPEPGGVMDFAIQVLNTSVETVTLTSLWDDQFGNLVGLGTCDINLAIQEGAVYACAFSHAISGNAGVSHINIVTATATDDETNITTQSASAIVTFTDVLPTISVNLDPSVGSLNEPGGNVNYTLVVINNSPESVTLTSLVDDTFGDLTTKGCSLDTILPGGTYTCSYLETVIGFAGDTITNNVTVQAADDEGNMILDSDNSQVSILDSYPIILVTKDAGTTAILEPGALVPFSITVDNLSGEPISITMITDDHFGDLGTDCGLPQGVPVGGTWNCSTSLLISGNGGESHVNTITVTAEDVEGNTLYESDSETVGILDMLPSIQISHTPNVAVLPEPGGLVTYSLTITNTSVEGVTLVSLLDDQFGNLNGKGTCSNGISIPVDGTYSCSYPEVVSGNGGEIFSNQVTASIEDDETNQVSANSIVGVLILDVLPTLVVEKTADPITLTEPGGSVDFSIRVENTSVEDVSLIGLTDDVFGPLDGKGTCGLSIPIPSGGVYTCEFAEIINGNANYLHTNLVNAAISDDELNLATGVSTATVTLTNMIPSIIVSKTATVSAVFEPGEIVTFTTSVQNSTVEDIEIISLVDDQVGDLNGLGTCNSGLNPYPAVISPGGTYTCQFSSLAAGNAGGVYSNTVLVTVVDDDSTMVSESATALVNILNVVPTIIVTKTASAATLNEPGGDVTFAIQVMNTSPEPITLTALIDNMFGDLTTKGCPLQMIASEAVYSCSFTETISGDAGVIHSNTVFTTAQDDDGFSVTQTDQVVIDILDVLPSIAVNQFPETGILPEPGGDLTYELQVQNTAPESLVLGSLMSDLYGNLNGQGTCTTGGSIPSGVMYSCSYSGSILGDAGQVVSNTVTVQVTDNETNIGVGSAVSTVEIQDVLPTFLIAKTSDKSSVEEPGEPVIFYVVIENTSQEDISITSLVDDYSGDLDGQGTCSVPIIISPGSISACNYLDMVLGTMGEVVTTTVTVTGLDNELNPVIGNASTAISITDRPVPTLDLAKIPGTAIILEPGGSVTFTVNITNTHDRDVVLVDLMDSVFGDLDGMGNCSTGGTVLSSDLYSCQFAAPILGNAGTVHTNLLTAEVEETGAIGSDNDDAVVTISDAVPSLTLSKTADLTEVTDPGQDVTFQIEIINTSVETTTLTALEDSQLGSLSGVGNCTINTSIGIGSTYSCSYSDYVAGTAGDSYANSVTAQIMDDEGNTATQAATVTLSIITPLPGEITGQVRDDLDIDGDLADLDPGIPGVTLELYDGVCVLGSTCLTMMTDENGDYAFTGIVPGIYQVVAHDNPGYSSTADSDGDNDNRITVTVISGVTSSGNDFLDTHETAEIHGQVRDDSDGDGDLGDKDSGLAGVIVTLDDGSCTVGVNCRTELTDSDGEYSFKDVIAGEHIVIQTDLPNYFSTADSDPPNDNRIRISVIHGYDSNGNDFLDSIDPLSCIPPDPVAGYILTTIPSDGAIIPISSDSIQVVFNQAMSTSGGGSVLANGNYDNKISNLTFGGDVPISFVTYDALNKTAILVLDTSDQDWQPGSQYELEIKAGIENACDQNQDVDIYVRFYTQSGVSGQVRNDSDADADFGDGDPGIPGVMVELGDGTCTLGADCQTTTTSESGDFTFSDLPAGTYTVNQYDLPGFTSTADADGGDFNQIMVNLGAAEFITGLDFLDTGLCSAPDPVTGYVSATIPADGEIVSIGIDFIIVIFNQAMSTSGGSNVLESGNFDDKIKNLTYGGDVHFNGVTYDPGTWTATLDLDTADTDWLPGSQYELQVKGNLDNSCYDQQGINYYVHFNTQSGIAGQVRNDSDADGNLGDNDSGVMGSILELADGSCTLGTNCRSTETDPDGGYQFIDLPAGTYTIHQYDLPGYSSTADTDGGDPNQISISVGVSELWNNQDFLDTGICIPPDPIQGFISSTDPSDGEILVPMDTTTILIAFSQPMATEGGGSVTDLSIYHDKIGNLILGGDIDILSAVYDPATYAVMLTIDRADPDWLPGSWYQLEIDNNLQNACETNQGVSVFIDFQTTTAVSGQVRLDADGDGNLMDTDPGIYGVSLELFDGGCTLGVDCRTTTTNSNGFYLFSNVAPGNYIVHETNLPGFISTADTEGPNDDQITLLVIPGSLSVRHDFLDTLE